MKIALVHDYLVQYGGAERVLEAFCEIWPDAPIYTLLHNPAAFSQGGKFSLKTGAIRTSFLQGIPLSLSAHRIFAPFMPLAVEQFDFSEFDVVLSDSASFAKGIITRPDTLHVCYCHTPLRYAWDDSHKYLEEFGWARPIKLLVPFLLNYIRLWDQAAAVRPDRYIVNSHFVRRRLKKYYNREAEVIHPPVEIEKFKLQKKSDRGDYYLMVGRLLSYKKFDVAIRAFNELKIPLKIVGLGPDLKKLQKISGPTIEFAGWVSGDDALASCYQRAKAFIFPQEEDFGIVAVEAAASGLPVIAYRAGGALEIVKENVTGLFFEEQTPAALSEAVLRFETNKDRFKERSIVAWSRTFSKDTFKKKIKAFVEKSWEERRRGGHF